MDKILCTYDLTYTLKLDREDPKQRRKIWDHAHFVSSLQGIVNRDRPRLYVYFIGGEAGSIDRYWLKRLQEDWLKGWKIEELSGLDALVTQFADQIEGLVAYDEKVPATS